MTIDHRPLTNDQAFSCWKEGCFVIGQWSMVNGHPSRKETGMIRRVLLLAAGLLAASLLLAHHGTSTYDMNTEISLTGAVKEWTYGSPHTWLWLTTKGPKAEEWSIESAPPTYLTGQGWSASTLKAGEELTILISPLRGGEPRRGILLEVRKSDGKTLVVRPRGSFGRPASLK
jgi:hypothetical protein